MSTVVNKISIDTQDFSFDLSFEIISRSENVVKIYVVFTKISDRLLEELKRCDIYDSWSNGFCSLIPGIYIEYNSSTALGLRTPLYKMGYGADKISDICIYVGANIKIKEIYWKVSVVDIKSLVDLFNEIKQNKETAKQYSSEHFINDENVTMVLQSVKNVAKKDLTRARSSVG